MFSLSGKLTFINIYQEYLKYLHDWCSEVYYKPIGYENKPYLGILINNDGTEYVIPLSSAKKSINHGKILMLTVFLVLKIVRKQKTVQKAFM